MDIWDTIALIGLSLLALGFGAYSWPLAPITLGAGLLAVYALREYSNVLVPRDSANPDGPDEDTQSRVN